MNDRKDKDNIIQLPTPKERASSRREADKDAERKPPREPMINLPPATKFMVLAWLGLHLLTTMLLTPPQIYDTYMMLGFVPGWYSGALPFSWPALTGPLTYAFLHGSWPHVLMNSVMMMAFGAGMERAAGTKNMFVIFFASSLCAALIHGLFFSGSTEPVIGASGGISGLFGALLVMLNRAGALGGGGGTPGTKKSLWPLVLLWLAITVAFGFMQAPGGGTIAWAAHIGGFLCGLALGYRLFPARP